MEHCVSCANGTDALYITMKALGLQLGDEVITTAHSWISTSETITQAGGRVVFCDTEENSYNINPELIESKITEKTKGIIPVHLYGQPADMDAILEIARKHNLWVIEDCAQAHLAIYKRQFVGTIGDAATFSFYPGKNLGAMGDAGCIVTNRSDLADFATLFSRRGGKGDHKIEGINSRMDGMQAAILNVKLNYLDSWTKSRINLAYRYIEHLGRLEGIELPHIHDDRTHVFHLFVIRSTQRDTLRRYLSNQGIPTVLNYPKALPFYDAYSYLGHRINDFPIAHANQERILSIPLFPELSYRIQDYIIEKICEFYSN